MTTDAAILLSCREQPVDAANAGLVTDRQTGIDASLVCMPRRVWSVTVTAATGGDVNNAQQQQRFLTQRKRVDNPGRPA